MRITPLSLKRLTDVYKKRNRIYLTETKINIRDKRDDTL